MKTRRIGRIAGLAGVVGATLTAPAIATDYVVNTTADVVAADGFVSLREAIQAANTNAAVNEAAAGEADGDTITIGGVPYPLSAMNGPLTITDDVVITGSAGSDVNGSGNTVQLFVIDAAGETVAFENLDLVDGSAASGAALSIAASSIVTLTNVNVTDNVGTGTVSNQGGAIENAGTLTITNGTISGNTANTGSSSGGAILTSGTLNITGTTFSGNSAGRAGGAIEQQGTSSSTTLTDVTMTNNTTGPMPGNGGGVHISGAGSLSVSGGTYDNNVAANEGGALWNGNGTMAIDGAEFNDNVANGDSAFEGGGALFNNSGTLTITDSTFTGNTALVGAGSGGAILNAPAGPMGDVGGTLSVTNSTFTNNQAARAGGAIEDRSVSETESSPGVFPPLGTPGSVTLDTVTFTGNTAGINGGGLHITGPASATITALTATGNIAEREGGALWNGSGPMTVADSTITGNAANGPAGDDGGGGIFNQMGDITITGTGTLIADNTALGTSGSGGGIFNNNGTISITDATIRGNVANRAGGGIEDLSNSAVPDVGNPTITLTNVTLDGNSAGTDVGMITGAAANPGNGGGLHITGQPGGPNGGYVLVTGSTVTNNIATEGGGLWNFGGPTTLEVASSTFTSNTTTGTGAQNGGGALFNNGGIMTVADSNIMMNSANAGSASGGGLLAVGGTVTVTGTTFSGNDANRAGGAIEINSDAGASPVTLTLTEVTMDANQTGSSPGNGGGLHVSGPNNTVTIDRSTVSNNVAANEGGGLWNFDNSDMRVWNSTIFGNTANGAPGGGGIFNRPASRTTTLNVTIAGNSASAGPGGGVANADTTAVYEADNTLIADNTGASNNDLSGEISDGDNNLVEDTAGATLSGMNNITGMDAGLDMAGLANNGGPTLTVALTAESPAIDAGQNAVCTGMAIGNVDQRGIERTETCDIGAFELTDNPVATVGGNGTTNAGNMPQEVTVTAGATDVPVLGLSVTAPAGEALSVSGFEGTLSGTGNFNTDVTVDVLLDANGNGVVDAADTSIPATISLDNGARSFEVAFTNPRTVPAGQTENYILAADFGTSMTALGMPMMAGGGLLLLGLAGIAGFSRRKQLLIVGAIIAGAGLTACDNSSTLTRVDTGDAVPGQSTFQFTLTGVSAAGAISMSDAVPSGLPVSGPRITVEQP